jgi:5-hydroxyisourate hydrolase-like protein (transthyretin family)
VGQLRPNGWGLFDMAGNVAEWCWDVFGDYAGGRPVDPVGTQAGQYRVARGGSWNDPGERCRSGARASYLATGTPFKSAQIGFRVALAPVYEQSQPVAQSGLLEGTITGRITMQTDGMPAPGVQVTLVNTSVTADTNNYQLNRRAFVQVAMSDSDGRYTFSNVKPGDYGVSPFRSDTNSTYYFQQDPATEPAQLKVNKDVHQVNFIVDDPSLLEGVGEVVFNVRVINSPPDAGFVIKVKRRYWMLFIPILYAETIFDWDYNVLPRSSRVYSYATTYGWTAVFVSKDNFYSLDFNVWGVGPDRNLGSKVIYFPLNACPAVANFVYDYNTGAFYQVP